MVELLVANEKVVGSNPTLTANIKYPMDYARIMCVGKGRQVEAALTLNATHLIKPKPTKTHLITPWQANQAQDIFVKAGLSDEILPSINFIDERDWDSHNTILPVYRQRSLWFYQQALKFTALDILDSEAFLIQDCDVVPIRTYEPFIDGIPNVRVEMTMGHYNQMYVDEAVSFLSIPKTYDRSYVSELFPYLKRDYLSLKKHVMVLHGRDLLSALIAHGPMDDSCMKWLSEYEILGIWKDHIDPSWTKEEQTFVNLDFRPSVIKFRTRPSKFMTIEGASKAKEMINRLTRSFD